MTDEEELQIDDLLSQLVRHCDRYSEFVAEVHFILDACDTLFEDAGGLSEPAHMSYQFTSCQIKEKSLHMKDEAHYLHGIIREIVYGVKT